MNWIEIIVVAHVIGVCVFYLARRYARAAKGIDSVCGCERPCEAAQGRSDGTACPFAPAGANENAPRNPAP